MEQLDYNDKQGNPLFLYHNPVNESSPEEIHKAIRNLLRCKTICKQPIGLKIIWKAIIRKTNDVWISGGTLKMTFSYVLETNIVNRSYMQLNN